MTPTPPDIHPDGRYNATQAAALLGIDRKTLARWAAKGKVRQRMSRTTQHPRYAGRDLLSLWRAEY